MAKGGGLLAIHRIHSPDHFQSPISYIGIKRTGKCRKTGNGQEKVSGMDVALGFLGEKMRRKESGEGNSGGVEGKINYTNPCDVVSLANFAVLK